MPLFVDGVEIAVVTSHRDLGVVVDTSLRFHLHVADVVRRANGVVFNILRSTECRSSEFMRQVFISHIRPLLDFGSVVWNTGFIGDLRSLERVQRRWTKRVAGLANLSYSDRLSRLDLFSISGRLLRTDLIFVWKILNGFIPSLNDLFVVDVGRTRGHSFKLRVPRFHTDSRSRFFSVRVVALWNSLPESVVSASSLTTFKRLLATHLGVRLFAFA